MSGTDLQFVMQWWFMLFVIGIGFIPFTNIFFSMFFDKGYIFAKVFGMILISYAIFVLGIAHVVAFTKANAIIIALVLGALNFLPEFSLINNSISFRKKFLELFRTNWKIFLIEECIFLIALIFWSFIRAYQPDIHGLEKYMDFGFVNSILRSIYFPPTDMWFTPLSINYYYFGHLQTAVLIKISGISAAISYNLMLATLFAFAFTGAFSIVLNLFNTLIKTTETQKKREAPKSSFSVIKIFSASVVAGLLSGFLVSLAGNLHTIYTFFSPYVNEKPVPFWKLQFLPIAFPNSYWYPNATRFVENTIHEFPLYSFVVSDLHGHVLDIPIVLLIIALLFSLLVLGQIRKVHIFILGFLIAVMYMTNVWDGIIYFLLSIITIFLIQSGLRRDSIKEISFKNIFHVLMQKQLLLRSIIPILSVFVVFIIFSLPFSVFFKPFTSGIGVLCAPEFLTKLERLGPLLFEPNHCMRSPWWQLATLYGFFYIWVISFLVFLRGKKITVSDVFILFLILISTLLIVIPEFVYIKDIYPAHYRANTMFKLVYQAFIMLSIVSAYSIVRIVGQVKLQGQSLKNIFKTSFIFVGVVITVGMVSIYPYYAVVSYYEGLRKYRGLDGVSYIKSFYPDDYKAILWLNENIKGQPVILEAQGDSYTDYARVSSNTGLPTVLGWTVHEWLWRGTYDIPAPRILDVQKLYETESESDAKDIIKKYEISLVFVGDLERQKYTNLTEKTFKSLGKVIYQSGNTRIYQITQEVL